MQVISQCKSCFFAGIVQFFRRYRNSRDFQGHALSFCLGKTVGRSSESPGAASNGAKEGLGAGV